LRLSAVEGRRLIEKRMGVLSLVYVYGVRSPSLSDFFSA